MRFSAPATLLISMLLAQPFGCSDKESTAPSSSTPEIPEGCLALQDCCGALEDSAASQSCLDALIAHADNVNAEAWCKGILGGYQTAGLCPGGSSEGGSGGAAGSAGNGGSAGSGGKGGSAGKGGSSGKGGAPDAGPDSSAGSGGQPCPAHDPCTEGEAIPSSCSNCAAQVCVVLDTCCSVAWTAACVAQADSSCGGCGAGGAGGAAGTGGSAGSAGDADAGPCSHDECTVGAALDSSCTPCVATICSTDPYCCTDKWNTYCVDGAKSHCNLCGGAAGGSGSTTCAHSECVTGVALESLCSWCVSTVCDTDPYCCTNKWNSICVDESLEFCGICD